MLKRAVGEPPPKLRRPLRRPVTPGPHGMIAMSAPSSFRGLHGPVATAEPSSSFTPALRSVAAALAGALALAVAGCGGGGSDALTVDLSSSLTLDQQIERALSAKGGAAAWRMPASDALAAIPQDPRNPLTAEKVALGRLLYHDSATGTAGKQSALSSGTYSCASCHHASFGFQAGLRQGIGEGGWGLLQRVARSGFPMADLDVQPVRTPSDMNGAWQQNLLWNGQFGAGGVNLDTRAQWTPGTPKAVNQLGYEGLETQAIAGQAVHRIGAAPAVYRPMFDAAYPDVDVSMRYDAERAGLAIAAYERTLMANRAPWQRWLAGETAAMNDAAKRGALLFLGKANCASCHSGPALNLTPDNVATRNPSFFALGFKDMGNPTGTLAVAEVAGANLGRGGFTGVAADRYKFKTPQLYNLSDSPFFGHGGSMTDLRAVVAYFNAGMPENPEVPAAQLAPAFKPLGLSAAEIDDLTEFLKTGLRDPELTRYQPATLPSGQCAISDDAQVRQETGCPGK